VVGPEVDEMTEDKDFKRLVRRRMKKTGESYTAARARLIAREKETLPPKHAALAGMSDDAVRAKTGLTWPEWVALLDRIGAQSRPHRETAAWLREHEGLTPWWSQTVTVGYERIRGLRKIGQRSDGTYEATKSRTFSRSVSRLYEAFVTEPGRSRWLAEADAKVRGARRNHSVQLTWGDGTPVEITFTAKGDVKTQVSVQHGKLPDKSTATALKVFWADRLEALGALLDAEG